MLGSKDPYWYIRRLQKLYKRKRIHIEEKVDYWGGISRSHWYEILLCKDGDFDQILGSGHKLGIAYDEAVKRHNRREYDR